MSELSQSVIESIAKSFSNKQPADEEVIQFKNRILSYIEGQKWATRPLILSPPICAQYGWKCVNPNLLTCVSCNAKLCTQEPTIEIYDAYKACVSKILSDLKGSHKTHCPWPLTPIPESLVKMVPQPKEEALSQFIQRLKPCLQFECSIPKIKQTALVLLGLNQHHVTSLCKLAEISLEDVHLIGMSVVCMAATGWSLISRKNGETKIYVNCSSCQRLVWTKSYNLINTLGIDEPSSRDLENNADLNGDSTEISDDSPTKRIKLEKIDFDPLEEHRPWCLWVSTGKDELKGTDADDSESSLPGWTIFLKSLLRYVSDPQTDDLETSPSKEQLKNARNLLNSWTNPVSQ